MIYQNYKYFQVSAEPDGATYVFQGFIKGKDYGQFGLQRLGNIFIFLLLFSNNSFDIVDAIKRQMYILLLTVSQIMSYQDYTVSHFKHLNLNHVL